MARLDGVLPTAMESARQRREAAKRLSEIDRLLRDECDDMGPLQGAGARSSRKCSFGSGRLPKAHSQCWLNRSSTTPGPGAYEVSAADGLIKPTLGGGGALGLRSSVCCRLQPCRCNNPPQEMEISMHDTSVTKQDTKQSRRSSPSLVPYPQAASTEVDYETREQQKRVAAIQAEKQRWKRRGLETTPNYRWTERRCGAGGATAMSKGKTRDGVGVSSADARVRKLLLAGRKSQSCGARNSRATDLTTEGDRGNGIVKMSKASGRDTVRCKRKGQRVLTRFGGHLEL